MGAGQRGVREPIGAPPWYPSAWRPGLRYSLVFACWGAAMGVVMPNFKLWLEDARGISDAAAGLILAAPALARPFAAPFTGAWADSRSNRREPMVVVAAVVLACFAAYWVADGFWPLLAVALCAGVAAGTIGPVLDASTVTAGARYGFSYGPPRSAGSLAFLLGATGAGYLIAATSTEMLLVIMVALAAVQLLAAAFLPLMPRLNPAAPGAFFRSLREGLALVRRPRLMFALVAASLVYASHAGYYNFSIDLWREQGIGVGVGNLLFGSQVIFEIVFFLTYPAFARRVPPEAWIALGAAAALTRWSVMAFAPPLWSLWGLQSLHALSFAATHVGALYVIEREVHEDNRASAQLLFVSLGAGLLLGGATIGFGALKDAWGAAVYGVMAGLAMAALVLLAAGTVFAAGRARALR